MNSSTSAPGSTSVQLLDDIAPDRSAPTVPASEARCADGHGTLAHLFFSQDDLETARAKAICRQCASQPECLSGAIERQEYYGVWGGVLLVEGVPVQFPPRRGRPAVAPRIDFVADAARLPDHLVA